MNTEFPTRGSDTAKPWVEIVFTHTDGSIRRFTSVQERKPGPRLSGFDGETPFVGDLPAAKRIAKAIKNKAISIVSVRGTNDFTSIFNA